MKSPQKPSKGRVVRYVMPDKSDRAAEITVPCGGENDMCNMIVTLDGPNDGNRTHEWRGSVNYSEGSEANTWHWPPRD